MKRNVKSIKIILDEAGFRTFTKTPTYYNLLHQNQLSSLVVGENIVNVNHAVYHRMTNILNSNPHIQFTPIN